MARPRKPLILKEVEGDTRQRGVNKHAEALASTWNAERGIPEMPESLQPREGDSELTLRLLETARECWDYHVGLMAAEKLLSTVDQISLAALCLSYAGSIEAMRAGDFSNADKLMGKALQAADRMGLNESARARLNRPKERDQDQAEATSIAFLRKRSA